MHNTPSHVPGESSSLKWLHDYAVRRSPMFVLHLAGIDTRDLAAVRGVLSGSNRYLRRMAALWLGLQHDTASTVIVEGQYGEVDGDESEDDAAADFLAALHLLNAPSAVPLAVRVSEALAEQESPAEPGATDLASVAAHVLTARRQPLGSRPTLSAEGPTIPPTRADGARA